MASPSLTQLLSNPRWHSKWPFSPSANSVIFRDPVSHYGLGFMAVSRKKMAESLTQEASEREAVVAQKMISRTPKRTQARSRKKVTADNQEEDPVSAVHVDVMGEETNKPSGSGQDSKKTRGTTQRKGLGEEKLGKAVTKRRKTKKTVDNLKDKGTQMELSDQEGDLVTVNTEDAYDEELELGKGEEDDISFTYGWPPLVCCYGAAQHAFVPSGRPANRLIDYEMHDRLKDALWTPEKFVRAPGGCASNVAVALANLGGKVAFMGKIGDDDFGQALLYYLNVNNVQTRSIRIDSKRVTAVSQMKIGKRGGLRMTCVKPCAEDSLSRSEINIDVLKEAKMFYFNTFSLLDRNMRSTTLQALKISKKLGGVIFYDLNLPLPLWQSCEETKIFIQQVWNLADIIEVTKQELEFLCGIKPSENFDTKDNDKSKFVHHTPETFAPLWHENLKVLFVTNGTSKIHYYTKDHNGAILGMEDAPVSPFTRDMSASGDGIVAALMRMLTVQPHLINDKGYLEHTVKYAINCGVIDHWLTTRTRGFPPREGMEENVEPDPNGIRSITEREYRTLGSYNLMESVL
ncbi:Fructokinase-like 2, chloroplastic [Sarracenia purpurea var. burkii]